MTSEEGSSTVDVLFKFYDLIESMMDLNNGTERCILAINDTYQLKALALVYAPSSERFKQDYRKLISDIRSSIPDKDWQHISDSDAKLSSYIDNLIQCFSNITIGIKDMDSTMNNLRREYRNLWGVIVTNVFAGFAGITTTNIVDKFYDLTESMMYLTNIVRHRVSESSKNKTTLKALALVYAPSSERFKQDYRKLISDIRSSIPDKDWQHISDSDAKLSSYIDNLIEDFGNITERKEEINSTMNNLRREYRNLWEKIFTNVTTKSSSDIDRVLIELKEISAYHSSTTANDSKLNDILELIEKIQNLGNKKAINYSRFEQYDKAAEQYSLIATAYREAHSKAKDLIDKSSEEPTILESLLKTAQFWDARAEEAMEKYDIRQVINYKNEGEELLFRGLYSEALESFDEALKFKPSIYTVDVWIKKGNTYSYLNRFDDAITCYEEALSINRNSADAWYNKGKCFVELKKYDQAIKCFDRAIEITPNDYGAWEGKGNSLYFMGKYDEANICFDTAIAINPEEHILWFNKGLIFLQREEIEKAAGYFEKALEINPDSLSVRATLAQILLMKREYDKYEKLVKEISNLPESENYEFGMRLLNIIYSYLDDKVEEATKATMSLLDYYESIAGEPSSDLSLSNWNFHHLQSMIEKSNLIQDTKSVILSLVSLPNVKSIDLDSLRAMTQQIYNDHRKVDKKTELVSPMRIKDIDIKVVNTSSPVEGREGWYDWEIHIEPENVLPQIDYVQYTLHPTFHLPIRRITESEGGFKLKSTGWSEFKVKVQILLKNGKMITKYHWLRLAGPTPLDSTRYTTT